MAGVYKWRYLSECDLSDSFFDSLKNDYPGFEDWYNRKASTKAKAFTYHDDKGLGAFVFFKHNENEQIDLVEHKLPAKSRLKISTLKLSERIQGNRLGEGAIGIALWEWLESNDEEIYVTVFEKHQKLIDILKKFGFKLIGHLKNNECVYLRNKNNIDFSTPYSSFPFVSKSCDKIALLPINDIWHDKLFPYSELKNTRQETEEIAAANGITKTYICFPSSIPNYHANEPIMIYRRHSGNGQKTYKSVVTSYGVIVRTMMVKHKGIRYKSFDEYVDFVGNKSVFTKDEIARFYNKNNLFVLEIVYNKAFGAGNNVNHHTLYNNDLWPDVYPFLYEYSLDQFCEVLKLGNQDINKLIK